MQLPQQLRKGPFWHGFRALIPIIPGIVPFGAVMGTVCANAKLSLFQTVSMNFVVFAGASQLAAVDLMRQHTAVMVIVVTGLIINLRFLLYSAALSPMLQSYPTPLKLVCAYLVTDQNYAVMSAHQNRYTTSQELVSFYLGSCLSMLFAWHLSVVAGYAFGNFAPQSWSLDYAIPLSFVALVIPTMKNRNYVIVAAFSSVASLVLNALPFKLGLIATALLGITLAAWLTKQRSTRSHLNGVAS